MGKNMNGRGGSVVSVGKQHTKFDHPQQGRTQKNISEEERGGAENKNVY